MFLVSITSFDANNISAPVCLTNKLIAIKKNNTINTEQEATNELQRESL